MNLPILQKVSAQILAKETPAYRRWLFDKIDFGSKLIGIKGPRGSGKSTMLLQYAKMKKLPASKVLFINCDHPAMVGNSLYDVAEHFYARGGELLFIDEIHKSKNFSQELKAIYDIFDLQVIFSGSSALKIEHASGDLSRRAVVHNLGVLSLREFVELETGERFPSYSLDEIVENHFDIASDIMSRVRPLEQFSNYLEYGCYPFYHESLVDYPQKLLEVINLTIDSDLSAIYNIETSKLVILKKIIYMLCVTEPYDLNVKKLSSAVETSWSTLAKYLERMDAGSLIHIVRQGEGMRAVNRPDKLLLDNPNLFMVLCASPNIGSIRETFFVSQVGLKHQVHYHDKGDFMVDDHKVFEVGGASKSDEQLEGNSLGYVAADDIEIG
ncbi:MAG: AAA family ATPase, partial [Campylobacterota bacterium]|nr:AAA family ATPase [Campylobacterota bacterium]